jgi:hypothetical protein
MYLVMVLWTQCYEIARLVRAPCPPGLDMMHVHNAMPLTGYRASFHDVQYASLPARCCTTSQRDPTVLEELIAFLPSPLAWRVVLVASIDEYLVEDLLIERYYRCIIADRARMLGVKSVPGLRDQAAKRTILNAMALAAGTHWSMNIARLAERLNDLGREHMYHAAKDVCAEYNIEDTGQIRSEMIAEGIWPYEAGFVIEIIGDPFIAEAWPIPPYMGRVDQYTRFFPGPLKWIPGSLPNIIQLAVNTPATRPESFEITSTDYYRHQGIAMTALEVLQRLFELRQMQDEMARERPEAQIHFQ